MAGNTIIHMSICQMVPSV